jgi:hypothetical protein
MRRVAGIELLMMDDLAPRPCDATGTTDFYEIRVERRQHAATVVTSNPVAWEWPA